MSHRRLWSTAQCSIKRTSRAHIAACPRRLRQAQHDTPIQCRSYTPKLSIKQRQWSTPLAKTIAEAINTTGPISIAAYMRQCLTSPDGGYYTTNRNSDGSDQFGARGDFTTSPEISQIFGELIGIWFVSEWLTQGRRSEGVEIMEVGPGRGTLMDDLLRSVSKFPDMVSAIETVYLVEASPMLREKQRALLCGEDAVFEATKEGWRCKSKHAGLPITWCEDIRFVPNNPSKTPFMVAHEFFDALPIHAFQAVPSLPDQGEGLGISKRPEAFKPTHNAIASARRTPQWRELLVDNVASHTSSTKQQDEFELRLAKAATPSSLVLPTQSPRYHALLSTPGATIEICPEAHIYAADFARRIGGDTSDKHANNPVRIERPSGAALIIDYGPADTVPRSTLRGIQSHKRTSPFRDAGRVDLSADVDFLALAHAALRASSGVEVHGPAEQGHWLEEMGVHERAGQLTQHAKSAGDKNDNEKRLREGVDRLLDRSEASGGGMGRLYKVLAMVPERDGSPRPDGFKGMFN